MNLIHTLESLVVALRERGDGDEDAQILNVLLRMETKMAEIDDKITELGNMVAALTTAEAAAEALISSIPTMITDAVQKAMSAGASPAQLQSLTDLAKAIGDGSTKLAAAVVAGTPVVVAPPPPPAPPVVVEPPPAPPVVEPPPPVVEPPAPVANPAPPTA